MALVYVGGNTGTWAGATAGNNNVSLTALTGGIAAAAAAGDFVVAVYATGSAADRTLVIQNPSAVAYTLIDVERYANGTTYDSNLRVAFRRLPAAEANVVFGPTGNAQDAGAAAIHVWRGVDSTTPQDVTAVGTSGTGTGRPNPPAITPTTAGAVVIAAGGAAAGTGVAFVGTGLSNFRSVPSVDTNDAMVGIGSFAWTSGTYDPAAWTGGTTNAADSWTSITLALRPAATQTLTPALYTNDQTFFSPTVTQTGATQALTPALYTNDQTFHNPTVSASNTLTPALYTNDQTFYSADITQTGGTQTLTPDLYSNAQTFYTPTVASSNTLTPALYTNAQTFYTPTVTTSVTLLPSLYTNDQTFYGPVVTQGGGPQTLLPDLYTNAQTFYAPTVTTSITLLPSLYTNAQTFYAPTVTTSVTLAPALYTNTQEFYSPTVSQGAYVVAPSLYTNTQTFYSPTVTPGTVTLAPQGYVDDGYVDPGYIGPNTFSTQVFYTPTVTSTRALAPALFTNTSTFFSPTVALESYLITKAQALKLYKVWLLHGLGSALTVGPTSRVAGSITQSVAQAGDEVTVTTTAAPTGVGTDPGTMLDELALLHGIDYALVVTPTSRTAGSLSQTLAVSGGVTTVTRT